MFKGYLKNQLQGKKFHVEKYDYSNADCDDVLLTVDSGITDFEKVEAEINKGFDNPRVDNHKDLLNSWAYVILFEKDDKKVDSSVERTVTVAVVKKDNTELEVYHIADEDTLEKVNSSYITGELRFNIKHFSKFTIVERIKIGSKDLEERTKIEIPEKIENKVNNELPETKSIKDEKQLKILPKAGISANSSISAGFVLLIVASIIRKKKNYI